jgi:release factor glutamine methyltransferase
MTSGELTAEVTARLAAAGCVAAAEEAAEMVAAAPGQGVLETWIRRRENGEPLAWITGTLRFGAVTLHVDRGVYVPRLQSEELAERAAALLGASGTAADLCTGSGALAAHLLAVRPGATVVAVDLDLAAVRCARRNGVPAVVGDLGRPLREGCFDVVTAVAPYVPTDQLRLLPADVQRFEPRLALDGGDDGLDVVREVVSAATRLLKPGGWVVLEVGGTQDEALAPLLSGEGYGSAATWRDDDGDVRGIQARLAV